MRLEWLEDILAVAETGSFSDAAERRLLTQSAFSRRIQSIEDHVGVELFDRTRKPVQLHATTAEQRDRIAQLAGALRQLTLDLRQGAKSVGNRIVIASQHALTTALTPGLIRTFTRNTPISMCACGRPTWMSALRNCSRGRPISRWSTRFRAGPPDRGRLHRNHGAGHRPVDPGAGNRGRSRAGPGRCAADHRLSARGVSWVRR